MTGITEYDNMTHPLVVGVIDGWYRLTVDRNGDDLCQDPAVRCLKGWDSLQRVELLVLSRETVRRVGLDEFNVEVVFLRNSEEDHGSGIALSQNLAGAQI